jgi:hypothetical protein
MAVPKKKNNKVKLKYSLLKKNLKIKIQKSIININNLKKGLNKYRRKFY